MLVHRQVHDTVSQSEQILEARALCVLMPDLVYFIYCLLAHSLSPLVNRAFFLPSLDRRNEASKN